MKATAPPPLRGARDRAPAGYEEVLIAAGPTDAERRRFVRDAVAGSATAALLGDRILGRLTARAARRHVMEGHRLLADVSRSAIPGRAFRRRVLAALRAEGGLATVVEWLRGRGYDVSLEGLLAAWVERRPADRPGPRAVPARRERR